MIWTSRAAIAAARREIDIAEADLNRKDERARVAAIADPAEFVAAARAMPPDEFPRLLSDPGTQLHRVIDALYDLDPDLFAIAERSVGKDRVDSLLQQVPAYCRLKIASPVTEPTYEVVDVDIPGTPEPVYDEAGAVVGSVPVKPTIKRVRRKKASANARGTVASVEIAFPMRDPPAAYLRLDELRRRGLLAFSTDTEYRIGGSEQTPATEYRIGGVPTATVVLRSPTFIDGTEMLESVIFDWFALAPELRAKVSTEPLSESEALNADSRARSARAMFGGGGLPPWPRRARRGAP